MPPLPTRLTAGSAILKHTFDPSGTAARVRALGREPLLRVLLRRRVLLPRAAARPLLADPLAPRWVRSVSPSCRKSLAVAAKSGAMKPADTRRVIVDTTVQPKNVAVYDRCRLRRTGRVRSW